MLNDQGFIKTNQRSGWRPGHLTLTNERLVLHQPARNIFETHLDRIAGVTTEKKGFILKRVDSLRIVFNPSQSHRSSVVWVMVKDPAKWQGAIFSRTKIQVSENDIEEVASELDPKSRLILFHVWENRHASIQELAGLYDAPNHMEVLQRIRGTINPVSEKRLGFPLLVFERKREDPESDEKVLFSWWIIGERRPAEAAPEPLMDLFDEQDAIVFIMELKGVPERDIRLDVIDNHLKVRCDSPAGHYAEDILLPAGVIQGKINRRFHNDILEVQLPKSSL